MRERTSVGRGVPGLRRVLAVALACLGLAVLAAPAVAPGRERSTPSRPTPSELWRAYPLEPGEKGSTAPSPAPATTTPRPSAPASPSGSRKDEGGDGTTLRFAALALVALVVLTLAAAAGAAAVLMRRGRGRGAQRAAAEPPWPLDEPPRAETVPAPRPEPAAEPEPLRAETVPAPRPEPAAEPEPLRAETVPAPRPEPAAEPEPLRAETVPAPRPEPAAEPEPPTRPEPAAEPEPLRAETVPAPRPEPAAEPEPPTRPDPAPEPHLEPAPTPESKPQPEPETGRASEAEPHLQPDPGPDPVGSPPPRAQAPSRSLSNGRAAAPIRPPPSEPFVSPRPVERHDAAPAPVGRSVWLCEIEWRSGDGTTSFVAVASAKRDGRRLELAESRRFPLAQKGSGSPRTARELVRAVEALSGVLVEAGWRPVTPGRKWYSRRFVWSGSGVPPQLALSAEEVQDA